MVTIGVDVASQPAGTAACWIRWEDGRAWIQRVEQPVGDERLRAILRDEAADKVGVDVPLGWPAAFVAALAAHQAGRAWPPAELGWLVRRVTDRRVYEETGQLPLSVSADRLAYPAIRVAALMTPGLDRSGEGRVVEVYPAAALRRWGLPWRLYKGAAGMVELRKAAEALRGRTGSWLDADGGVWTLVLRSHDAFDALIACLVARAKAIGRCADPPAADLPAARVEGWIALPEAGSLERLPRPGRPPGTGAAGR